MRIPFWLAALVLTAQVLAVSPTDYVARMGVGIDANWATFKKEIAAYDSRVPRDFAKMGFTHVRIRAGSELTPAYLDHLERVVKDSLAAGLVPVLAYGGGGLNADASEENVAAAVDWWRVVAERFAGYPEALSFDLFIEPAKAINERPDLLLDYYRRALAVIRPQHPGRIVFLAPRRTAKPDYLPELEPLFAADEHLAAESHFYASGPSKRRDARKWTSGTPAERAQVQRYISALVAWREKTGVPVWQGAWMPGNYNKGNEFSVPEQVAFATFMACSLRAAQIPYAVNADQKFYDNQKKSWLPEMLPVVEAFIRPNCR